MKGHRKRFNANWFEEKKCASFLLVQREQNVKRESSCSEASRWRIFEVPGPVTFIWVWSRLLSRWSTMSWRRSTGTARPSALCNLSSRWKTFRWSRWWLQCEYCWLQQRSWAQKQSWQCFPQPGRNYSIGVRAVSNNIESVSNTAFQATRKITILFLLVKPLQSI